MELSFHMLAAHDAANYRALRLESLKFHPDSFGSSYESQRQLPKLKFEEVLENPDDEGFMVGAFDKSNLIGICGFLPFHPRNRLATEHIGILIQVYVKAAYSGRKVGLGLIQSTVHEAFNLVDMERVVLEVKKSNTPAIRVYDQVGFQMYHPVKDEDDETLYMFIEKAAFLAQRFDFS